MSASLSTTALPRDIERIALLGWRCVPATRSKKGMFKGYLAAATCDLDQLDRWAREYRGCNWKVVPQGSGVWAWDVDVAGEDHAADGVAALKALCEQHGPLPPRPHGRSGSGGHLLVFCDTGRPFAHGESKPCRGIDTCGSRVAFTVSPSINARGLPYRWTVAPWELEPPVAPDWVYALLPVKQPRATSTMPAISTETRARALLARVVRDLCRAQQGGRNGALNRAAFTVGGMVAGGVLAEQEGVNALYAAGRHIGLEDAECCATIISGLRAGSLNPLGGRG